MITSKTNYLGELRTESEHIKSEQKIVSDAPTDNRGKGEAFSPTDLLATALTKCMITIMGIAASEKQIELKEVTGETEKIMGQNPRRVSEIRVRMKMNISPNTPENRVFLERAALNCPVAKSLSKELIQDVEFDYIS